MPKRSSSEWFGWVGQLCCPLGGPRVGGRVGVGTCLSAFALRWSKGVADMADLVLSNTLVLDRCTSVQSKLNAASRLRLFSSAHTPSSADSLAIYTAIEATFDTYAIKTMNPSWAAPVKIVDGQYQTVGPTESYSSPVTTPNTLYGLFVDDNAGNLLFALEFDTAIIYGVGAPALSIQIAYNVWSESLHP